MSASTDHQASTPITFASASCIVFTVCTVTFEVSSSFVINVASQFTVSGNLGVLNEILSVTMLAIVL